MSSQGQRPPAVRHSAAQPRAHREPGADCPLTHPQRCPQRGVRPTTPRRRRPSSAIPRRGYRAGKLYLAAVEDLFSRRLLGFAMSDRHDAELAVASLRMAAAVRGGSVSGVIFHTDQGSEYTSGLFTGACRSLGVVQSMGRVGSALDNAAAESFFSTLEHELLPPPVRHPGRSPAGRRRMDRPLLQPDQAALHHRGAVTHDYELAATTAAAAA